MNGKEILRTLEIFKPDEELVEIRIIGNNKNEIYSGYYKDPHKIVADLEQHQDKNIYFTLNAVKDICYSKLQRNKLIKGEQSTKDTDIAFRTHVLIDIDTDRGGNKVSSTNEELDLARKKANRVRDYLRDIGFPYCVVALSGSGYHLIYKCNLANTEENNKLIKDFLEYLSNVFSDDKVQIDKVVFNASRITRLYGTTNRKGANTEERPHRESRTIRIPTEYKEVDKSLFQKVADMLPKKEKPTYHNNYGRDSFDIDNFIAKHGIKVDKDIILPDKTRKILLEECIFDSSHKSPDSAIFVSPEGAIGYFCFHNSCSDKKWRDVRMHFEPEAYEKKYVDNSRRTTPIPKEIIKKENDEIGAKWLCTKDISNIDRDSIVSVPSGFKELDDSIVGFDLKELTVWSGSNASGKSSALSFMQLTAIERGFKVAIWSGELPPQQLKSWIVGQAAGRQYVKQSSYNNAYYTPKHITDKIDTWLDDKLFIYNNDYGNRFEQLMSDIEVKVKEKDISVVVIDNLFSMNINSLDGDKYSKQTQAILDLSALAKKLNIHIHMVAHPRKVTSFLRKVDISGTADLTNCANNVIIIHRVNKDFERGIGEFYGHERVPEYMKYGNVIEITKNRSLGVVDKLVGLYYEVESRRFLNDPFENPIFGWYDRAEETGIEYQSPNDLSYFEPNSEFFTKRDEDLCPF